MKKVILIVLIVIIVALLIVSKDDLSVVRAENSAIYFNNSETVEVDLYDLVYIGALKVNNTSEYAILSGRSCSDCDENISIYISPIKGIFAGDSLKETRYTYPGKIYDYVDNKLVFQSRMFYGPCFESGKDAVTWIQEYQDDNSNWIKDIYAVNITEGGLMSGKMEYNESLVPQFELNCTEHLGIDYFLEP